MGSRSQVKGSKLKGGRRWFALYRVRLIQFVLIYRILIISGYELFVKTAQDDLATNLEDQKKTVGNLVATVNTLANSLKPMINQHMEAANMTMTQQVIWVIKFLIEGYKNRKI